MRISITSLICATLLLLAACQPKELANLQVEDLRYALEPSGAKIISGKLTNVSTVDVSSAQVMVSLFDEHNQRVGQMGILVKDISAGESVHFREPIDSDDDIRAARVRKILVL